MASLISSSLKLMRSQAERAWYFLFGSIAFIFFFFPSSASAAQLFAQPDLSYASSTYLSASTTASNSGNVTNIWMNLRYDQAPTYVSSVIINRSSDNATAVSCLLSTQNKTDVNLNQTFINVDDCTNNFPLVSGTNYYAFIQFSHPSTDVYLFGQSYSSNEIFVVAYSDNEDLPSYLTSTSTRFFNEVPLSNSTTSAPVTLEFDYYINSDDVMQSSLVGDGYYYDCMRVAVTYGTVSSGIPTDNTYSFCPNFTGTDHDIPWFAMDQVTHFSQELLDASSTYIGDVFVSVSLFQQSHQRNFKIVPFFDLNSDDSTWNFAIGSYTLPDGIFATSSFGGFGYSAAAVAKYCSPIGTDISTLFLNTDFSASDCVTLLFVPNGTLIGQYVKSAKDPILTHFPLGYVSDFISTVSTTSTTTLTVIDAYVPGVLPGANSHIHLDLYRVIDPLLNATTSVFVNSSASSTQTLYQITLPYWRTLVYVLAVFYIISRVLGAGLIPKGAFHSKHDNEIQK